MGFLDSILGGGDSGGSSVDFLDVPETPEATEARKRLFGLATGEPPAVPLRQIAPLQPMTEERQLARTTAKESLVPQEQQDFMSLPEVQGLIQETVAQGNLLSNRISRGLQASGSFTSTPGRDVLSRVVTDVQKSIASTLAPFASEQRSRAAAERQRIQNLIPVLEGLGLTEEDRQRMFEQAGLSADYEKEFAESKQLETFTIPLLQSILGSQPAVMPLVSGGGASSSGISSILGPLLTSVMGSGSGGGGADFISQALSAGVNSGSAGTATGTTPSGGFTFG